MPGHMTGACKKGQGAGGAGFTLIEMAIVMVIVGIVLSIVASVMPAMISTGKIREGRAVLERYDHVLEGYVLSSGNFPCPDTDGDGLEDRTEGASPPADDTCDSYVGDLPYRTLGLSNGDDNWHNPVRYGVYEDLVQTTSSNRCTNLSNIVQHYASNAADTAKLHITDSSGSINKAYLLASGGASDLDGANGFFDGLNGDGDEEFEIPDKTVVADYDDIVRSSSFAWLSGKLCTGSDAAASGSGAESSYTDGCTNGTDDDGDSYVDCLDQDCDSDAACSGAPDTLEITTTSIPAGAVNTSYTTTFQASGGTTPYEWTLTGNGGFTGLSLHTYTGQLSGTLDKCAGTYSITVEVEDSTDVSDGGPLTDSKTVNLVVANNLSVSRTSGAGTAITWNSNSQEETFTASGGHLGDIDWTLGTGGASGFTVESTGSDSCVIKVNGSTTAGSYSFTLTATDAGCAGNTANVVLSVTVDEMGAPGTIGSVIESHGFDTGTGRRPSIVNVSGDVFAIAYEGPSDDGWLRSVTIDSAGNVADTGHSLEFDESNGEAPHLVHVTGDVYAVAYKGPSDDGWLKTVTINVSGGISATGHSLEFDNEDGDEPRITHVSGDIFAVSYEGPDIGALKGNGWLKTVTIDAGGTIVYTGNSLEFDSNRGRTPRIIHVSGDVVAVAYEGEDSDGWLKTFAIDFAGSITPLGTLEFDTANAITPSITHVSGDVYAIAYEGDGGDGWLKTVTIDAGGATAATGYSREFDTTETDEPVLIHTGGDVYAVAYRETSDDGFVKTVTIASDGQISAVINTLEFATSGCYYPDMIQVAGDIVAIAYGNGSSDGYIATLEIE